MSLEAPQGSTVRLVRSLLVVLGTLVSAYALSDHPLYGGEPGFGGTQRLILVAGIAIAACAILPVYLSGRVLLLGITGLAALGMAEVTAERLLGARLRPVFRSDDRLVFELIPDRSSVMTRRAANGGETVAHRINSEGFRGGELRPSGEALRIAVYGDSFIHAVYSPDEETFAMQLQTLLASRLGREVEVVNAGVSSYGPDQILLKMEDELSTLRPRLAIVAVFAGNDYGDLMRNKMFRLDETGNLVPSPWSLDPKVRIRFELSQRESILKRAMRELRNTRHPAQSSEGDASASMLTDMDFLLEQADGEYQSFVVERDPHITNTHVDYYSADLSLRPSSESARYKIALMAKVLERIRDVSREHDTPLVFLFIPHPVDVTGGEWDSWAIDRTRFPEYDGRNQIAPLEAAARALGVPHVSLYDVYRSRDARALYFRDGDDHWNAAGQRLAAESMADALLSHGWLPDAVHVEEVNRGL